MPAHAAATAGPVFTPQQRLGFHTGDDWEPAVTADRFGHVYVLYKHYDVAGGGTCGGCDLHLLLQRSDDDGATWSSPVPIAPGPVKGGQYDSQIKVDPVDGRTVWASFLQNNHSKIAVVKSVDFGVTWSAPVVVSGPPPDKDKDELAVRGNTIVVAYDDGFNTWASVSTNAGVTWRQRLVFAHSSTFGISLAAGTAIDSGGRIFISWDSFDQAHAKAGDGPASLWVSSSEDMGATWRRTVVAVSGAPPPCADCGWDYLGPQMALALGPDDVIYTLWNAAPSGGGGGPEQIYFSRSADHGNTYVPATDVSGAPAGVEHAFPALAVGPRPGEVSVAWMDTRTGAWNLFYRQGRLSGRTFGPTARVSSFVPGYSYLTPAGFALPYGDYFEMTVGRQGRVKLAFGEGPSYAGPGNIWFSSRTG